MKDDRRQRQESTRFTVAIALCFLATSACMNADAQTLRQRALERFDSDGDGRLSDAERQELREFLARRREDRGQLQDAERLTWQVDGIEREALVYVPEEAGTSEQSVPVVFGFHGHGGSAVNASRSFGFHQHWPEALVVYMQGIPTPGRLTDPDGKRNGWQHGVGEQDDRDLKFFDMVLATLKKKYRVDPHRIYASGHSNGGAFTYLLWAERSDVFAAMAPSAASSRVIRQLEPKPAMHIAGRNDELVWFAWQRRAIETVRQVNGCAQSGSTWDKDCTLYESSSGTPLVTLIHDGSHKYPAAAPPLIVKFFKEHRRPAADVPPGPKPAEPGIRKDRAGNN